MTPVEWVAAQLDKAPPLTAEQRTKLAELLRPVRITADPKRTAN